MADMGFRVGVEVGVQYGGSAEMFCTVNPQLHLTCIDPYLPYPRLNRRSPKPATFEDASKFLSRFNVTMVKKKSMEVVDSFRDGSLDFVHIDADHSFDCAMQDFIGWVPKVRKGGLILGHDYFAINWGGVTQAVQAYLFAHHITEWWVTADVSPTVFWQRGDDRE